MEVLDTTIVNVALPHIAGSLSSSSDEATWALTSYLVANGIVLTISGWLGDMLGRKRYFIICIAMFTVCSFLCGTSTSLAQLIVFRLAQGFFGGGLQPNQQSIILDTFPPAKRSAAFGVAAIAIVVAPVLGPTLGGYITDHATWRWIFFLNVPVGILAVFLVSVLVEDPPWEKNKKSRGIDYIGLSLITLGLGSLPDHDGPRRRRRLVRVGFHLADGAAGIPRHSRRHRLAAGRQKAHRRSRSLQGSEFFRRMHHDRRHRRHPLCQRRHHSAICAAER